MARKSAYTPVILRVEGNGVKLRCCSVLGNKKAAGRPAAKSAWAYLTVQRSPSMRSPQRRSARSAKVSLRVAVGCSAWPSTT